MSINVPSYVQICQPYPIIPPVQQRKTRGDRISGVSIGLSDAVSQIKQLIWSGFIKFLAMCRSSCDDLRHSEAAAQLRMLLLHPTTSGDSWLEAAQHRRCRENGQRQQREIAALHCQSESSTDCFCKSWQCTLGKILQMQFEAARWQSNVLRLS